LSVIIDKIFLFMSKPSSFDPVLLDDLLTNFANLDNFWGLLDTAFGARYDRRAAEGLRSQWQASDFSQFPDLEVVNSSILGNANGAYDSRSNRIYLLDTFVANSTPASVNVVLLEEIGHFVGSQINLTDNPGDEGAIFAALFQGQNLVTNPNNQSISSDSLPFVDVPKASVPKLSGLVPLRSVSLGNSQGPQDYFFPPEELKPSAAPAKDNATSIKPQNAPAPKLAGIGTQKSLSIESISNAEVFRLSSNPLASKTIYLDFDGYNTSATAWNADTTASRDRISSIPVFSLDSTVSTSYSQAEFDAIKQIFLRVAADYAPFNVNVTTSTPTTDRITRSDSSDSAYGTVVAIGDVGSQFSGAGGIAYVGIYDRVDTTNFFKPALVFPSRLGSAKNIAEAASHEAGHNLNLSHDGQGSEEYYRGGGSSPGWAPIMGVGYDEQLTQFSRGQYSNATNTENDFVKIAGEGVGRYIEGVPNTDLASAETINLDSTGFGGVYRDIQLASDDGNTGIDYDYFKFTAPASGSVNVSVNNSLTFSNDGISFIGSDLPVGYGNLHLDAQIYNASGSILADWDNNASVDVTGLAFSGLIAGQNYFVKVGPNSTLPDQSSGETTWGSLGSYALRIDVDSNPSAPTLAIAPTNAVQTEGNSGNKAFTFTVTRTGNLSSTNTVNWAVTGSGPNPANANDFGGTLPSGSITFAANQASSVISVNVSSDTTVELNEDFTVTLSNPTNGATITTATANGTIQNDDGNIGTTFNNTSPISIPDVGSSTPYPSAINVSGLSGNINSLKVTLTNLNHTFPDDIDVLLVSPTGAKSLLMSDVGSGSDLNNVTLTFDPTATSFLPDGSQIISGSYKPTDFVADVFGSPAPVGPYGTDFSVFNNTNPNGIWSLYVVDDAGQDLGSISGGWSLTIGTGASLPVVSVIATDAIAAETLVGTATNPGQFTLSRTGPTTSALTVNVALSGTATNGTDYATIPTSVIFAAGSSSAVVNLNVIDDTLGEGTETAILNVTTGTGYTVGTAASATVNVSDNDVPSITLAVSPAFVLEDGAPNLVYTFTRTGATTSALTVNYGITGTADGTDYTGATPGAGKTITFAAGSATATATIDPKFDTTVEVNETVALTLAAGTGYTVSTTTAVTGTITNDDIQSSVSATLVGDQSSLLLTGTNRINGAGNSLNNSIFGNTSNNRIVGGPGKDMLTGGGTTDSDTFAYNALGESLLSGYDVITDFNSRDRLLIPFDVETATLAASAGTIQALTATAISGLLSTSTFAANTASAFTATGQVGTFIALNDGRAGFQSDSDAVIFLQGYSISSANIVELI
jgi:subtilisin-like proprotein convertase family protein